MLDLNQELTDNFTLKEFFLAEFYSEEQQQRVLDSVTPEILCGIQELSNNLQILRNELGVPITVNIGFRPVWWELFRERSGTSQHCFGFAADIYVEGVHPHTVHKLLNELMLSGAIQNGGLGKYNTFTHYDIRLEMARW